MDGAVDDGQLVDRDGFILRRGGPRRAGFGRAGFGRGPLAAGKVFKPGDGAGVCLGEG